MPPFPGGVRQSRWSLCPIGIPKGKNPSEGPLRFERGYGRACSLPSRTNAQLCPSTVLLMLCHLPQPTGIGATFWPPQESPFSADPVPLRPLLVTLLPVSPNYSCSEPHGARTASGPLHSGACPAQVPESCHQTISSIIQDVRDRREEQSHPECPGPRTFPEGPYCTKP